MEVILNQEVKGVGNKGDKVKVKDGFARNFLIPKGLAVVSTASNLKKIEQEKNLKAIQSDKLRKKSEDLKDKLAALSLTIPVLIQEEDKLYGSIASTDISCALKEEGFDIDKNDILLEGPIKSLGIYEVPIKLHPEVSAKVKVWVVKK
jgi:large subunit ribosomal protein L9